MKYKLLFTFLVLSSHIICGSKLEIYLSFNECLSCYSALSQLDNIYDCEKLIFISKEDSAVSKEFLENYVLPPDVKINFCSTKITATYCKLYKSGQLIDTFSLRSLVDKIELIKKISTVKSNLRVIKLPKKFTLKTDRIYLFTRDNFLNISDYILNKNIILELSPNSDSARIVQELKGNEFLPQLLLSTAKMDSLFYKKCYKELKKLGKGNANIESSFMTDSSLFLLLNFPIPVKVENDWEVDMSFFLYQKNLRNNQTNISYINADQLFQKYNYRYFPDNTRPFFIDKSDLFFSLSDETRLEDSICLYSKWTRKGETEYVYNEITNSKINKQFYFNHKLDSLSISINQQYYFNGNLSLVIDYINKKNYDLSSFLSGKDYVNDIIQSEGLFKAIVLNDNKIQILTFNLGSPNRLSKLTLELPNDIQNTTLVFLNSGTILGLNKENSVIYTYSILN